MFHSEMYYQYLLKSYIFGTRLLLPEYKCTRLLKKYCVNSEDLEFKMMFSARARKVLRSRKSRHVDVAVMKTGIRAVCATTQSASQPLYSLALA